MPRRGPFRNVRIRPQINKKEGINCLSEKKRCNVRINPMVSTSPVRNNKFPEKKATKKAKDSMKE